MANNLVAPFVENDVKLVSPMYRGLVKSGRNVALSGDGYVDVPINATLGTELLSQVFIPQGSNTVVDNGDGTFTINIIDNANGAIMNGSGYALGGKYNFEISNMVYSEPITLEGTRISGTSDTRFPLANGEYTYTGQDTIGNLYFHDLVIGSTLTLQISVKEIQSTQGQITFYDATQKRHIGIIEPLPLSTHYQLKDVTFNNLVVLWDRSFTQADRDLMDANPELVVRWALGEDVFSIGVIGVNDKVYTCSEDGAYLLEMDYSESAELVVNGDFATDTDWTKQTGWTIAGGKADTDGTAGAIYQDIGASIDPTAIYSIVVDTEGLTTLGGLRIELGKDTVNATQYITKEGRYSFVIAPSGASSNRKLVRNAGGFVGNTDNLSVKEILSDYLTIQGTYSRQTQLNYGLQTLALKLNNVGVPTALADPNTLSFVNNASGLVDTQFLPNLDTYSIEYNCTGMLEDLDASGVSLGTKSQRTEQRLLTHDAINGNKLYIDGIEQQYAPTVPDASIGIHLNQVATIGYTDIVDTIENPFVANSIVVIP